jgi:hypothetical protein
VGHHVELSAHVYADKGQIHVMKVTMLWHLQRQLYFIATCSVTWGVTRLAKLSISRDTRRVLSKVGDVFKRSHGVLE